MTTVTRNSKLLASFTRYCHKHPEQRFWQALRNWSGMYFAIFASDVVPTNGQHDTFYWEKRNG